ncbi:DNA-binding transcriptional regulator, MarR family [Dyella sp. OK004]|uniref:MarR family winged helix-turn-helix transcriptional regulator n=1 Tax=Dyella sp. OK004 TaxID=1855292 RepID=UPI0008F1C08F|nr:MarR family transcriptional regulator [Dyella sp. OK004]SFS20058.1 DNA-binding transcriptional regulator, MarR family [Dyella sp. OK004]
MHGQIAKKYIHAGLRSRRLDEHTRVVRPCPVASNQYEMRATKKPRRTLELELGEQLNILLTAAHALANQAAACFDDGLQPAAFHIARWLHAHGAATSSTIAAHVAMDRSATSRLLGQLQKLGFVARASDDKDRRGAIFSLTREGRARLNLAPEQRGLAFYKRTGPWSDDELRRFTAMIRRFNTVE